MPQYARLVKLWEGVRRANAAPLERDISAVSMDTHTRFSLPRGDVPQVGSCSRAEVVAPRALRRLDCTWQLTELGLAVAQWGGTRGIPAPDPALSRSLLARGPLAGSRWEQSLGCTGSNDRASCMRHEAWLADVIC